MRREISQSQKHKCDSISHEVCKGKLQRNKNENKRYIWFHIKMLLPTAIYTGLPVKPYWVKSINKCLSRCEKQV